LILFPDEQANSLKAFGEYYILTNRPFDRRVFVEQAKKRYIEVQYNRLKKPTSTSL
jgi:hypothetical protein